VLFGVWVYGQVSATTANRCQWSPSNGWSGNALDSCLDNTAASLRVNDSSNAVCHCLTDPPSFVVTRQGAFSWVNNTTAAGPWYSIIAGQRIKIRKIPGYAIRYASVNGIHLTLSDNAGNPSPFNYLLVKLGNIGPYGNWTLTNTEANFWGRVW
jgi:hypothetical protein